MDGAGAETTSAGWVHHNGANALAATAREGHGAVLHQEDIAACGEAEVGAEAILFKVAFVLSALLYISFG